MRKQEDEGPVSGDDWHKALILGNRWRGTVKPKTMSSDEATSSHKRRCSIKHDGSGAKAELDKYDS